MSIKVSQGLGGGWAVRFHDSLPGSRCTYREFDHLCFAITDEELDQLREQLATPAHAETMRELREAQKELDDLKSGRSVMCSVKDRDAWRARAEKSEKERDEWKAKAAAAEDDISILRKHCRDVQKLSVDQQFYIASLQKEISKLKNNLGETSTKLEEYSSRYDNLNLKFCDRCNEINSVLDVLIEAGVPFLDSNRNRHSIADRIKLLAAMRYKSAIVDAAKRLTDTLFGLTASVDDGDN